MNDNELLASDFRNVLWLVWNHLNLPDPTEVQYDIADFMKNGPPRIVIEAYRGAGKSWMASTFVVDELKHNPQLKNLTVSASKERSDAFSIFCKRLIEEIPYFHSLRPRTDQRSSNVAFDVGPSLPAHAPSVKSVGITGQLVGSRGNLIVPDDVETPQNALTQITRDKLLETIKEFDSILLPGGRIVYLGTPQTENTIYNTLEERGYVIRCWPGRIPHPDHIHKYKGRLAPFIEEKSKSKENIEFWRKYGRGLPTDPKRFTDLDLLEREQSMGKSTFALQFLLDCTLSDADRYPLKLHDLVIMDLDKTRGPNWVTWCNDPEKHCKELHNVGLTGDYYYRPMNTSDTLTEYQMKMMFIDPAGRGKDEVGYAVFGLLNGQIFLLDAGGLPGGYDDKTLESLAYTAKDYGVNTVVIEDNFGDGMYTKLFQPILMKIHRAAIEEVKAYKQKEVRIIEALEPIMNQHRLIVNRHIIEKDSKADKVYQLFYQMTRLTREKGAITHDDRLDAVSGGVEWFKEMMATDVQDEAKLREEELLDADLEKFHRAMDDKEGVSRVSGHSWTPENVLRPQL